MTRQFTGRRRGRPAVKRYPVQVVLLMTESMAARLDRLADSEGLPRAEVARGAIASGLDRYADKLRKRRVRQDSAE